jgi:hypothetical protein
VLEAVQSPFLSQTVISDRCAQVSSRASCRVRRAVFERIVSTPSGCPGDEDAFGGPRPASVPEFAHVKLLPKQLIKQQGNKTNNPYGRPRGVRNRATVASLRPDNISGEPQQAGAKAAITRLCSKRKKRCPVGMCNRERRVNRVSRNLAVGGVARMIESSMYFGIGLLFGALIGLSADPSRPCACRAVDHAPAGSRPP